MKAAATLAAILLSLASLAAAQESKVATLYAEKIYCDACAAVITKTVATAQKGFPSSVRKVEP